MWTPAHIRDTSDMRMPWSTPFAATTASKVRVDVRAGSLRLRVGRRRSWLHREMEWTIRFQPGA